jgi:hypothetical protein
VQSVIFMDAEDASGWPPEAATLSSRGTFIQRELSPGCPHRNHYYTQYGIALMHHLHIQIEEMVEVVGLLEDGHGDGRASLLTSSFMRTLVQERAGFRWVHVGASEGVCEGTSGGACEGAGSGTRGMWESTFANSNVVLAVGEDLTSAFVGAEGYPELGKSHMILCDHLSTATVSRHSGQHHPTAVCTARPSYHPTQSLRHPIGLVGVSCRPYSVHDSSNSASLVGKRFCLPISFERRRGCRNLARRRRLAEFGPGGGPTPI